MNKVADGDFTTQIETESKHEPIQDIYTNFNLTHKEKKQFINSFIEKIEVYPRELPNGKFLKSIHFKFPIFYEGEKIIGLRWDKDTTVETVVSLVKLPARK